MADTAVRAAPVAAPSERIPFTTKLAFGAGDLSPGIASVIIGFFQALFLTTVAGLRPDLAGLIVFIGRFVDAMTDPMMGIISDRTVSRLGRRRLWMLIGSVPFGLAFFAIWVVPPLPQTLLFWYYLVVVQLFNLSFTMVNVPYTALTAELTRDYDERTSLNSFRFAFSIGGSIVGGLIHGILITRFCADPTLCTRAESQAGYFLSAAVLGTIIIFPFLWCVLGTRERTAAQPAADVVTIGLLQQFRIAFSNRPFLFVVGIYLCSWLALQITQSVIGFYLAFYLQRADIFPLVLFAVQGTAMVFLFIWSAVSRRVGKKAVYYAGMTFWLCVQAGLYFVAPTQVTLVIVLAALAGVGVATAYLVPWSLIPDVIEIDELRTGQRREGIFYGFMVLLNKIGVGLGIYLTLRALTWSGFDQNLPPGQQPDTALQALRWMIGPAPMVLLVLGMVLVFFYPLTKQRHAEIVAELQARE